MRWFTEEKIKTSNRVAISIAYEAGAGGMRARVGGARTRIKGDARGEKIAYVARVTPTRAACTLVQSMNSSFSALYRG